jgi:hypothetical protein
MAATRRKDEEFGTSQLGIDPGTQASTPVDETAITPQETMLAQREARMAAQPQRMPQPMGATGVNRPPAVSMGAVRGQEPGTRTNALGQTFDQSGRMTSMPNTGRWGMQTAADVAPQPTMQGGEFAAARGARAPIQGMQGTTPASERIESQKNLAERLIYARGEEEKRLERQFEALPERAREAQIARFKANERNRLAGRQVVNPQLEAQRAFNQRPEDQPQYQPGQVIGSGTYGAVVVGARGAQMPFVQDPMNPNAGAIPVSTNMSREEYVANTTPQQRQAARRMLMEQGGAVADQLQQIEQARSQMQASPTMRGRDGAPRGYVGQQEQQLQRLEDDLIYGAMRDPNSLISGRQRTAEERQRQTASEQRASQVERERAMKEEQTRNAKLYEQAYKEAETQLRDPFAPRDERRIQALAAQKYMQAGGSVPGTGAGPGAGMMQSPAGQAPVQSGAPDSMQQEIYVDPASPVEFGQTADGKLFAMLPDNEIVAGMVFQGEAVVLPRNARELALLPGGTKYVLPGDVSRNEAKVIVKPGEAGGLSEAARVSPQVERQRIEEGAKKRAGARAEPIQQYQQDLDEYNRLQVDARRMAVESFNQKYGKDMLKADAAGNLDFESYALRDRFQIGRSNVDARGAFSTEVENAMLALAQERYQDGKVPAWVERVGTQITGVSKPRAPAGYEEGMEPGAVASEDVQAAEQEYYAGVGALKENVQAERLVSEGSRAWRATTMQGGRLSVNYKGQRIPAVRVRAGNVSAVLPRPETAEQVISLLREQRPFAVEQAGRAMPYKFDGSDPMIRQIYDPNVPRDISARLGAGQSNPGAVAAAEWTNRTFGYLPENVRKSIARTLLADAGYRLTG